MNPLALAEAHGIASADMRLGLGWLWVEVNNAVDKSGGFACAQDLFAELCKENEGVAVQLEAALGEAAAEVYEHLRGNNFGVDQRDRYLSRLATIGGRLERHLQHAPVLAQWHSLLDCVTLCLVMSLEDDEYFACVPPSPRQRAILGQPGGCDMLLVPFADDAFALHAAGRVKLSEHADLRSLQRGVATIARTELWPQGYSQVQLLYIAGKASQGKAEPHEYELLHNVRRQIFEAASATFEV